MKSVYAMVIILAMIICICCMRTIIDAMFPRYTVLYQINEYGTVSPIGVQDNKTKYVYEPTQTNIALAKGDIVYVSPSCRINDKRILICGRN